MRNLPDIWRDADRGFGALRPLFRQLEDLFGEATASNLESGRETNLLIPAVDVAETDKSYILSFDMPGIDKNNIDIEVQGNQLTVSGERRFELDTNEGRARLVERRYGQFQRSLSLPDGVTAERVEASYNDGVLKIVVPKVEGSTAHKVAIGDSSSTSNSKKHLATDKAKH